MIRNRHELNITQNLISNFNDRLSNLDKLNAPVDIIQYEKYAIQTMLIDLTGQVDWFMKTINDELSFNTITNTKDIPTIVIGKRLQLGLDEQAMAEALGISLDEYNLLELNDFYGISKELLSKILSTLNINNETSIVETDGSLLSKIESNLRKLNADHALLRMIPVSFDAVKESFSKQAVNANYLLSRFLDAFKNTFSVDLTDNVTDDTFDKTFAVAFKRRVNSNSSRLNITSAFAAHTAWIISKKILDNSVRMKADPIEIRKAIITQYNSVTLESCLDYIWNQNIGVLPLDISRGFHGACFDFEDKKVIALNQQNKAVSRWKFDLLHEFYHALTMDYNAYIERSDIMEQKDDEEQNASLFASYVIFGSEMNSYVKMVLENCNGRSEYMKRSIQEIAAQYNLNIDDFSNYVAYKTSGVLTNFWGVAANLQEDRRRPNEIARNVLLNHLDFRDIEQSDLFLLQKILIEEVRI